MGSSGKIQHKAKPSAQDLTPSAVFYRIVQVYGAFTDLLVLRGRIIGVIQCDSLRLMHFNKSNILAQICTWPQHSWFFEIVQEI